MLGPDDASIREFYIKFYDTVPHSRANALYCERVYGRDLCQHGYADMAQIDQLITLCGLGPAHRVLDLGCGTGQIAEYISDTTGARVHGIDTVPAAIALATARTEVRRDRLTFSVGDMHALDFAPGDFDTVIGIDTFYYGDLVSLVGTLKTLLKPGGQIAAYYMQILFDETDDPALVEVDHTPLAEAFAAQGLAYRAWDYTQAERARAEVARQALDTLKAVFEAEGNLFLYDNRADETNGSLQFIDSGRASRFLYYVMV